MQANSPPESRTSRRRSPTALGIAIYAVTLLTIWAWTAVLTTLAVGVWWANPRWKVGALAACGIGMTLWLGVGVWEGARAAVAWVTRKRGVQ